MKKTFFIILILSYSLLGAENFLQDFDLSRKDIFPYRSPTKRFLGKYSYNEIDNKLRQQGIFLRHKAFYDVVILQEERGFMGYHASSHQFRVFQDIIRYTLEEIMDLEFKKEFYFFRLPGDAAINNHPSARHFLERYHSINDNLPEQRDQIISSNFTLFNNFDQKYECSAVFFEKAISFKPPNFEMKIEELFDQLGMPKDKIPQLFEIGEMLKNSSGGTLFQFFDLSYQEPQRKNAYEFVDHLIFAAKKKGEPIYSNVAFSDLFQSTYNTGFLDQERIVVNHLETLNPYSTLSMRRYDLNQPEVVKEYEERLRAMIRSIPSDKTKVKQYKETLKQLFSQ